MDLELPNADFLIPYEEEIKLSDRNTLSCNMLLIDTRDWGTVALNIVQGEDIVPISPTLVGNERWRAPVPPNTQYDTILLKQSQTVCKTPRGRPGSVFSLGFCPVKKSLKGTFVKQDRFIRFSPFGDSDQASASDRFLHPNSPESTLALALVEMEEPWERVYGKKIPDGRQDTRSRLGLDRLQSCIPLPPNKIKDVLGLFEVRITSPER